MGVMLASHALWNSQHPDMGALQARMVQEQSREIAQMAHGSRDGCGASEER